ncbi:helix-turn-helix transcriptional regulator [uncultured Treponema sp.]|uniref:helix-turn-helix domain-containing protein n=1 Tax=uncultured Treponema sp. TaxID=162155 RepID=UPI0025D8575C|nr:helix-turn-helix transcriptional regulator [uncultured Treponema sp.]
MTFRERLREQIEYRGLLDKEVAAQAGISKRTMDSYVGSESCMPSAEVAVRLAKVLGVSVEYLITGEATPQNTIDSNVYIINQSSEKKARNLLHHFANLSVRDQDLLISFAELMEKNAEQ